MFKDLLYTWLFKALEIVLVAVLGYGIYLLISAIFSQFWAVIGLTIIMYFFGFIIAPYIRELREYIYDKITGQDEED